MKPYPYPYPRSLHKSQTAEKTLARERPRLRMDISLHSFILGFLFGCCAFLAVWLSLGWVLCVGPACGGGHSSAEDAQLEQSRPPLALGSQPATPAPRAPASSSPSSHSDPIQPQEAGGDAGCPSRHLHIFVLILSAPKGTLRRNAIRGTWLHQYSTNNGAVTITPRFVVGTQGISAEELASGLEKENGSFKDLLLLPFLRDSYSNLTAKVLLGLQWAMEHVQFDYVIKTDDDSYVRLERLVLALERLHCPEKLYWGYFMGYAFPEASGKWRERGWFLCPHYLPYAMGGGYVLSRKTVSLLSHFSHRLKQYSNEDVSMATWLAPYRLLRKHDLRFDVESVQRGCNNNHIISHKERVRSMYDKFMCLKKNNTYCSEEKEIHPGYVYNWTALPLHCCERVRGLLVTDEEPSLPASAML